MENRSIDTAVNASIDLMTLNKKVVNMRAIVRRTRVHVINKLTRNINGLKNKKGTEEAKKKNLEKAQRYLHEIESIRALKDDKITKYSLANVSSFEEVAQKTTSSTARALARFADYKFMKEAVNKFREEHSDWRDLVALLLMQQTGRKFKSSKKDHNRISQVENINASKLMTEAYNQGLFRDEETENLLGPNRKKKKKKSKKKAKSSDLIKGMEKSETDNDRNNRFKRMNDSKGSDLELPKDLENNGLSYEIDDQIVNANCDKSKQTFDAIKLERKAICEENAKANHEKIMKQYQTVSSQDKNSKRLLSKVSDGQIEGSGSNRESDTGNTKTPRSGKGKKNDSMNEISIRNEEEKDKEEEEEEEEEDNTEEEKEEEEEDEDEEDEDDTEEEEMEEEEGGEVEEEDKERDFVESEKKDDEPPPKIMKRDKECVVKQLDIEGDNTGDESSDDGDDVSESDDMDEEEGRTSSKGDSEESGKEEEEDTKLSKRSLKKIKSVPAFLRKSENKPHRLPRDPFFEGGEMEEEDFVEEDVTDQNDFYEEDDTDIQEKFSGNKKLTKSLFYRPGDDKRLKERTGFSGSGRGSFPQGRGRGRGDGRFIGSGGGRGGFQGMGSGGGRGGFQNMGSGGGRGGFQGRGRGGFDRRGRDEGKETFKSGDRKIQMTAQGSANAGRSLPSPGSQTGSNSAPKPTEKLHPSWEASRKRKAQQAGIKAFAGTKITFNDD